MLETWIRPYLTPIETHIVRRIGLLSPDRITGASLALGIASSCAIALAHSYMAIMLLWISGICDMLDGMWARVYDARSMRGMYADLIADRAVEGTVALGLAYAYPDLAWYTTLFVTSVLLHFATFMLAACMFPNTGEKSVHYEASIIERSEAFIALTALLMFPAYRIAILSTLSIIIISVAIARFTRIYRQATDQ